MKSYLNQRAAPWVSMAVLTGGMLSALILLWVMKIEAEVRITISNI